MNAKKGFTLLEILIVVAIIGILLAVSSVGLQGYIQQLRLNEATSEVKQTLKRVLDEAVTQSREMRISVSSDSSAIVWETKPVLGSWQEAGRETLPNSASVSVGGGAVVINGRGLPEQQRQFQVTRNEKSRMVTLLTSGLVIVP